MGGKVMSEIEASRLLPPAPFVKWAGGKRRLVSDIMGLLPENRFKTYHEPMVGGGAVFFGLEPKKSVLNDMNSELMSTYRVVRDDVESLISQLATMKNSLEDYTRFRTQDLSSMSNVEMAARFIYLNKLSFNGLYRVNSLGVFNVPYGKCPNRKFFNPEALRAASAALSGTTILDGDYHRALLGVKRGDLVFIDPPYDSTFSGYTSKGFNHLDQEILLEEVNRLTKLGAYVLLCNSSTPFILSLYKDLNVHTIRDRFIISRDATKRTYIDTVVATNY